MPNQDRKLATIQTIKDIQPIPDADAIEVAKVMGWQVVIKKDEYKVGDKVVYFEIDSYLPREPRYKFLEKSCLRNMPALGEGLRLKTIKLRGQISQGLLMPLSAYPEHNLSELEVGTDVTELLGVRLYEVIDSNGQTVSKFHPVISKTDEIRAQSDERYIDLLQGHPYYITEKIDGSSLTISKETDDTIRVFSRNLEVLDGNNEIWTTLRNMGIIDKLSEIKGIGIAFQGEIYGPGIQKNRLKMSKLDWRFFNIINPETNERYAFEDWDSILKKYNLADVIKSVKVLEVGESFNYTLDELQEFSNGNYDGAGQREGIVIRPTNEKAFTDELRKQRKWKDTRFSFKVINNKYLLKHGE